MHSVAIWPRTSTDVRPLIALAPSDGSSTRSVNGPPWGARALSTPVAPIQPPFSCTLPPPGGVGQIRVWRVPPTFYLFTCVFTEWFLGQEFRRKGQESPGERREMLPLAMQDVDRPVDDEAVDRDPG